MLRLDACFFLTTSASAVVTRDGTRGVSFCVSHRAPKGGRWHLQPSMLVQWLGADAAAWLDAHRAQLKPGQPVDITASHLTPMPAGGLVVATSIALAPKAHTKSA